MPELPEVETIRRELEELITGKRILEVCVQNPKVIRQPQPRLFIQRLKGARIQKILRRAKVLILELSGAKFLVVHLKMTGQLVYPGQGRGASRVSFKLSGGKFLDYNDTRMFGELRLLDNWRSLGFIQRLGPEPFDLSLEQFQAMLAAKKTKIKPLLMDQSFIAGIGNIYAAELLFGAGIHPLRPALGLSDREQAALFKEMIRVLGAAIDHGGSSVDDYVRPSGQKGNYALYHRVYGRQGRPCLKCKTFIQRIVLGGRGTFFCPNCQR